jgi:hypothetical protein
LQRDLASTRTLELDVQTKFLELTREITHTHTKGQNDTVDYIKNKNFSSSNDTIKKIKRQATGGRRHFNTYNIKDSYTELVSPDPVKTVSQQERQKFPKKNQQKTPRNTSDKVLQMIRPHEPCPGAHTCNPGYLGG